MDCKGGGKIVSSVREDESAGIDEAQGKMQRCRSKGGNGKISIGGSLASVAALLGEGQEIRTV